MPTWSPPLGFATFTVTRQSPTFKGSSEKRGAGCANAAAARQIHKPATIAMATRRHTRMSDDTCTSVYSGELWGRVISKRRARRKEQRKSARDLPLPQFPCTRVLVRVGHAQFGFRRIDRRKFAAKAHGLNLHTGIQIQVDTAADDVRDRGRDDHCAVMAHQRCG